MAESARKISSLLSPSQTGTTTSEGTPGSSGVPSSRTTYSFAGSPVLACSCSRDISCISSGK
ncbi:hypothetical protein I7I50_06818 [Histoplasma capsulatum G186AR]|uniref:Uncharacterized protein n=1 Tax=Ajellomyces capsulatus TaxID=5037 RepID=A0A8H8D4Q3_AJECA|nr:hypothetical protein I7I52_10108 [Histoplasma capsulatum]QSS67671.1 hypothetical protein I7I50_06818 [Histoplasma capsulatum G186AR]